ncbi:MAG: nitroreductase [Rhodobacteraceae bacterium]|nr:nitroreductase [Paracoccaceae bacterium]
MTDTINFLLTRRSVSGSTLVAPAPDRTAVEKILTAGARVPDHKALVPWRFIVFRGDALQRMGQALHDRALENGFGAKRAEMVRRSWQNLPMSVAVVASPKPDAGIPDVEQTLSAGAVCVSVLNAALAMGYGANWITGWMAFDIEFLQRELGLAEGEYVAGFIHVGTRTTDPNERDRPPLDSITNWLDA